jgi:hypothetical protein
MFVMSAGNTTKEQTMTANLSTAAAKTLRTIAAAGHVDCYAGTEGIDCRTLKGLVRKGLLTKVTGGYARHAITEAGRAAVAPVEAPAPSGIVYLPADYTPNYIDNQGRPMTAYRGMGY